MILFVLFTLLLSSNIFAWPSAVPLAVRSPYLNCWLHSNETQTYGYTWSATSNLSQILGWTVLVRVDGLTYSYLGSVDSNLVNGTVKPMFVWWGSTQTFLFGNAGPMRVNLTFSNPIERGDWVKQSIPFSYMSVSADSLDNASHAVQVYSDINGKWNSGDRTQKIKWDSTYNSDVIFHSVILQSPTTFMEILDQGQWGTLYYAMKAGKNVTSQIALDADSWGNFTRNGRLNGNEDSNLRPISDNFVFAISRDLGTIQATQDPVVWAIGYTTDYAVNYSDLSGAPPMSRMPYYKIEYSNDEEMIVDFLNDFSDTGSIAGLSADKILNDSETITNALSFVTPIALAELHGSIQLTVGTDEYGNINKSDVMMFMKNIGGVNKNRVNAVEILYAAFPALMYLDPSLGAPLLEPLFQLQASHNYTIGYAAADLGSNYPSVSGINSNHSQGVEQTGNMLIMTYAHARASGDGSLISRYYSLLSSWADYLDASTLFITNQSSADNLTVNNQTNLAIKGIIAIQAMSKMASVVNRTDDVNKYTNAAARLYAQWRSLALSSDQHLLAAYGQSSDSWTLGYNLFADVWLGTELVESSVYTGHTNFIDNLVSTSNLSHFGMPVDNAVPADTNIAVSSWISFAAAMATNTNQGLRTKLINMVFIRLFTDNLPGVLPVYYDKLNGTSLQGMAIPAQGAMFAPLALKVPVQTINVGKTTNLPSPKKQNRDMGATVGGTIGGVVAIFAVVGIVTFVQRRRRWRRFRPRSILSTDSEYAGPQMIVTPFDPNRDLGILAEQQPLVVGEPEAAMIVLRRLSSSPPAILPLLEQGTPVPVGLSDKEIARLRTEGLSSPQPDNFQVSAANTSQSTLPLNAVTEPGESPLDTRRLHSEFESLRREVERLREEGLVVGAPPSYHAEGDG